jgi:hypothetical protein
MFAQRPRFDNESASVRRLVRVSLALGLGLGVALGVLVAPAHVAHAASVTDTTCTSASYTSDLTTATTNGDVITFNCPSPADINVTTGAGGPGTTSVSTTLTITSIGAGVTLDGNNAVQVFNVGASGDLTLDHLTIAHGLAQFVQGGSIGAGGGIENDSGGALTIRHSSVIDNTSTTGIGNGIASGGFPSAGGSLTISHSTIADNTSTGFCTGCGGLGGGLAIGGGTATIGDSTFSGNTFNETASAAGQSALGGAIGQFGGTATITNSTFSGNALTMSDSNTGSLAGGGAIAQLGGTMTITNSTITGNSATGSDGALGEGGGIFLESFVSGATLSIAGSIVAANSTTTSGATTSGANCAGSTAGLTSSDSGYNLEDGTTCHFSKNAQIVGTSALHLGSLANNGGPTQTIALQTGSAAIDQIPTAATLPSSTTRVCPATDQRDLGRPDAGESSCDMGAYESGAGANEQILALIALVDSFHLGQQQNSYDAQLQAVLSDLSTNNGLACSDLTAFINHVQAQSGQQLTPAQAKQLITGAQQIQATLGC